MERKLKKKTREPFWNRNMKLITICLVIVFIAVIIIANCTLKNIVIEGSSRYTEEELEKKLITKATDKITILFYLREKLSKNKVIPFIEAYDVQYEDKNSIKIQVYEKLVIGCIEIMGSYMYFDKDGMVVESSDERLDDVPLIEGLKYDQVILYEQLKVQKSALYDTILNLTKLIHLHELPVQSISFNSDFEVTLQCDGHVILCGKHDNYDEQIATVKSLLESAGDEKYSFDLKNYSKNETRVIAKPLE